ncbi:MAG: GIY-YIG nuclease family protein [Pseudomonadota bacterium]
MSLPTTLPPRLHPRLTAMPDLCHRRTCSGDPEAEQVFVYIMASRPNGTLYVGVTRDLVRRVFEHRTDMGSQFTARYGGKRLVWFEAGDEPLAAITREKALKNWKRAWKVDLSKRQIQAGEISGRRSPSDGGIAGSSPAMTGRRPSRAGP